jgi:hypothetical protein
MEDYVTHVETLLDPISSKVRPNWGYVEKFAFVEEVIKSFSFIMVSDEELIDRANELLGNENSN